MKLSPRVLTILLIAVTICAVNIEASGVIHGEFLSFPGTEISVTLYQTNWFGLSKTEVGRSISTPENRGYRFQDLSEGDYRLKFRGPYIMPGETNVELGPYEEMDLTHAIQPFPNYPAITGWLYAHVMNNPEDFPATVKQVEQLLSFYDDLDDCLQQLGESLVYGGLNMNSSAAYDRAVEMWQPGMPTNIPSDTEKSVANAAIELIEMGRMVLALRALLPDLLGGQSGTYFNSDLYKSCLGYAQTRRWGFEEIRKQYEEIHRMRLQAAAMLGSNAPIEPPAELEVFQPDSIHKMMFNFYFSQAYLYAAVTCQ